MEIPRYEPFYLDSLDALREEIARLRLKHLPLGTDLAVLASPVPIPGSERSLPNRFCAQPLTGHDAGPGTGAPGPLTLRRYHRSAQGGFGLIWVESTLAGATGASGSRFRLRLHEASVPKFRELTGAIRQAAPRAIVLLQLTHAPFAGPAALLREADLLQAGAALVQAAGLAAAAGFDGVDIQASHGSLAGALLSALDPPGPFTGSLENRARFLCEVLAGIRSRHPHLLLATRMCAYEATRQGFGVASGNYRTFDPEEPARVVQLLRQAAGLDILNVTAASPNLTGPAGERSRCPRSDAERPDEHPLTVLDRQLALAKTLREAAPGLLVVGSGLSWVRHFVPQVAAGAITAGSIDLAGLGRAALACPDLPAQVFEHGQMKPGSACMVCFACEDLFRDGDQPVGCVARDSGTYGPAYQQARRFAPGHLEAEARRCHFCEAAPCVAACPTGIDFPSVIRACLDGDETTAWDLIRANDVLPELTSRLSSGWLSREGSCLETALTGSPVPLSDLQYVLAWHARERGQTGVRLALPFTGRRVAVAGAGPAGIAATARLLELGVAVELFERTPILGGTPEHLIPASRFTGAREEIEALLAPAIQAGHLRLRLGQSLQTYADFEALRSGFDALLLATGFWQETALSPGPPPDGVLDAVSFLARAKRGEIDTIPPRVAILSGGDCAMDAARTAQRLGAQDVFVVFGGPRSSLHWHMPEDWFASPGVHALMHCRPLGYATGAGGKLEGLRILHTELGTEGVLPAGLAIEAMGLGIASAQQQAYARLGVQFTGDGRIRHREPGRFETHAQGIYAAGALVNGGDTVARCVAEGMAAAACMHRALLCESC